MAAEVRRKPDATREVRLKPDATTADATRALTPGATPARVNDVHSRLNASSVREIVRVESVSQLRPAVLAARWRGYALSIAGGRHSMGGQQFGTDTALLDMTGLNRVLSLDADRGLVTVEAGIQWPALVDYLVAAQHGRARQWGIVQKQTGADRLTIGGALAANIHGRGLRLRPIVGDVDSFELMDARGELRRCSRAEHPDLFRLVIGGYGLFGIVTRVTLRLAPRRKVERRVRLERIDRLMCAFEERVEDGFEYGDFQFAIDPTSDAFLAHGVFSCYRPVPDEAPIPDDQAALSSEEWRALFHLAHDDKSRAFATYARHYLATDGQVYWSDTHQLAAYLDGYHVDLDRARGARHPGSEMITELYVPRGRLGAFMDAVRQDFREHAVDVIYGTIRLIEPDHETYLAWARAPWACIVFNLHVDHTSAGIAASRAAFCRLIDIAIAHGGSYYLTYHRWARRDQVEQCYPQLPAFLALKRHHDPGELFQSDWYRHYKEMFHDRTDCRVPSHSRVVGATAARRATNGDCADGPFV